jgi:hypothetical protein
MKARCQFCTNEFDMPAERCPHCAQACPFANVWAASRAEDVAALELRYQAALDDAKLRGCDAIAQDFATALGGAKVVIARHIHDVERLGFSDSECYTTFHQALDGGLRVPDGDEWNELRHAADEALFPRYKKEIRSAALTLDDLGPLGYGAWSITLRTPLIERRASVFEENSLLFIKARKVTIDGADAMFRGHRAAWSDRVKLCIAKLAGALSTATKPGDFAGLLLRQVGTTGTDEFVEVHIWGSLTMRTAEKIVLTKSKDTRRLARKSRIAAMRDNLVKLGVGFEVRP